MDVLSTSYIIPGPNAVEITMHCGKERGGRSGLVLAGVCYILPAMVICLAFGYFFQQYSTLPNVQDFIFGLRPATTALVIATVFRLANSTLKNKMALVILCLLVFGASLSGINEVLLIIATGLVNYVISTNKRKLPVFTGLLYAPVLLQISVRFQEEKVVSYFSKDRGHIVWQRVCTVCLYG